MPPPPSLMAPPHIQVIYQRDDSQAPTDFAKGLRFWTRSDFAERAASLKLSAAGTLAVIGGGSVHIQSLMKSTRGVEKVEHSTLFPAHPIRHTRRRINPSVNTRYTSSSLAPTPHTHFPEDPSSTDLLKLSRTFLLPCQYSIQKSQLPDSS